MSDTRRIHHHRAHVSGRASHVRQGLTLDIFCVRPPPVPFFREFPSTRKKPFFYKTGLIIGLDPLVLRHTYAALRYYFIFSLVSSTVYLSQQIINICNGPCPLLDGLQLKQTFLVQRF